MTTPRAWGASPEDWKAWQALGLTSELLPVVMDPAAELSPNSSVRTPGKLPSKFNGAGQMVGVVGWTKLRTTDKGVEQWARDDRLGICLQSRLVKAFDIDIGDPVHAAAVADVIEMGLGALPVRGRPNSGKRLLAFRCAEVFPKRIIETEHGNIELLANGQQFLVCGTHPSGVRYAWEGGTPAEIPTLTLGEVDAVWSALAEQFAKAGGVSEGRLATALVKPRDLADVKPDPRLEYLDRGGWLLEYGPDGKAHITCPFVGGHSGDTGTSSTSYMAAGLGGFEQGHYKCLHASCAKRTDADFDEKIGYGADVFDAITTLQNGKAEPEPLPAFVRVKSGQIDATLNNVLLALRRPDVCGMQIGFDVFKDKLMRSVGGGWEPFASNTYTRLRSVLESGSTGFKPIGRDLIRDAVLDVAFEQKFDSAIQWANTLEWDGVERVEMFWHRYFGVEDTEYSRAVSRYTWSAFAGRCLTPGEKCDMVPVLIGLQGAGKTSVIESLSPEPGAFGGINLEKKDEDIARGVRGKLVCELAELRGLASRDAEGIKDWVSRRFEEWVPKYEEFSTRYGRRFLGIGTGNREGFLDDETGERRWLPMHVGEVDGAAVLADRDQLWAEGIWRYRKHGVEWQGAYSLGKGEHHKFKMGDVWAERLADWLASDDMDGPRSNSHVRLIDVLTSGIGLTVQKITRREELRAAKVLLMLGYKKGVRRINGVNAKVWVKEVDLAENCMDFA